jgi:hypothetical protein
MARACRTSISRYSERWGPTTYCVLKTGSDVHCELFEIIPRLAPGVIVHFHDVQFPFEYPREWVFAKRWSWNEIYAVRAFLAYNI